jgi:AAA domain/UvrD-like helicase C-terminal domain
VNSRGPAGDFTAEQMEIINLPVDAHALVSAAAGTGKTHTLAGRLTRLVEGEGLSAGDDVLVLSFSRAAVAELRRRITSLAGDARYVGATTFDSFATRILAEAEPAGLLSRMDYESRIRAAVDLLSGPGIPDEVKLVRHVLVDEIQDLVGSRAQLVTALLERADAGFTLFGDPAQAIYGHQEDGTSAKIDLHAWVRDRFAGDPVTLHLTHDHRACTPQARMVAAVGAQLRRPGTDHTAVAHGLRTIFLGLPTVGLTAARRMLVRRNEETNALLTRTNGEALVLSRALFDAGIPHRHQRPGEDKAAPAWIGELTAGLSDTHATRAMLDTRLERAAAAMSVHPGTLYGFLRSLGPGHGRAVDLRRITDRIREGDLPEELNAVVPSPVVVSTIHRAKGLEFDRVLLTDPRDNDASDPGEENRVLYVALSRARREIFHVNQPDTRGLSRDPATRRWVRHGFGRLRWKIREIEVTGRDTHSLHPAGTWLLRTDVRDTQDYLATRVGPGDPVTLELLHQRPGEDPVAHYAVYHDGHGVGLTSENFGRLLGRALGARSRAHWPQRIEGLHVELVDTVAGDASAGQAHGLGSCGLWLRVRVFGLGVLRFDNTEGADSARSVLPVQAAPGRRA